MTPPLSPGSWIYAVFGRSAGKETLTAFQGTDGPTFIPVLRTKEEGEVFLSFLPGQPGVRYEIQAILFQDVLSYAREHRCRIYVVNGRGEILEKPPVG